MNIVIDQIKRQYDGAMDRISVWVALFQGGDLVGHFNFEERVEADAPIPDNLAERAKQRIRELAGEIAAG